ncbi:hypothetical protein ACNDZW_003916, partial [Escherichia coli]
QYDVSKLLVRGKEKISLFTVLYSVEVQLCRVVNLGKDKFYSRLRITNGNYSTYQKLQMP